jgi:carbonic anhydrase/acetyltransferase-like protein (isoleucine patch superfamily)
MKADPAFQPLIINSPSFGSGDEARKWLSQQSELVRLVTHVTSTGTLYQVPYAEAGTYIDRAARLIGGLVLRTGCYVGPYAVIRLDEKPNLYPLIIDEESNIQDGAIIHSNTGYIGKRVIVAHQAIVHGARIDDDVAIYIQAVVDGGGTVVGHGCFLDQQCYVGRGIRVPPERYVEPGRKVLSQVDADRLPSVPPEFEEIRSNVLSDNRAHVSRHRASMALGDVEDAKSFY